MSSLNEMNTVSVELQKKENESHFSLSRMFFFSECRSKRAKSFWKAKTHTYLGVRGVAFRRVESIMYLLSSFCWLFSSFVLSSSSRTALHRIKVISKQTLANIISLYEKTISIISFLEFNRIETKEQANWMKKSKIKSIWKLQENKIHVLHCYENMS